MSTSTLAPAPAFIGPVPWQPVSEDVTVDTVENSLVEQIATSAKAWKHAGSAISEIAGLARGLGINAEGVWEGAAADAADHRMDTALNHADSTGWAASHCGTVTLMYTASLKLAKAALQALRSLEPMIKIKPNGTVTANLVFTEVAVETLTAMIRTTLGFVEAAQAAAGATIDALTTTVQEIPTVGWAGASPSTSEVMPSQTIALPYGTADVVGDPATAQRIITLVGGVGSRGQGAKDKQLRTAQQLADEKTAVISWNGYYAPSNVLTGTNGELAKTGGLRLRAFQDSLRQINPGAELHVSGYSYGSVVVGNAAGRSHLDADRVTFIGSPGVPVNHVSELNLNEGARVDTYAMKGDAIEALSTGASLGKILTNSTAGLPSQLGIHGADPTAPGFGAENLLDPTNPRSYTPEDGIGDRARKLLGYAVERVDDFRLIGAGETNSHSAYYEDAAVLDALKKQ